MNMNMPRLSMLLLVAASILCSCSIVSAQLSVIVPSFAPSDSPSDVPSDVPSQVPSILPSELPSIVKNTTQTSPAPSVVAAAPVTALAPTQVPVCFVCGAQDLTVNNLDGVLTNEAQTSSFSCGQLEDAGLAGLIGPAECSLLPPVIFIFCGCV